MTPINLIAKMIDHSVLHPTFTDYDLRKNCEIALKYDVATVCVKPYHVQMAADLVKDSDVGVCAVIGFPHGNSRIVLKMAETLRVIEDGATEVDMVVNVGKVLQGDWEYVSVEIKSLNETCKNHGALLKVIFETDFITSDHDKIKLCEICSQHGVAFVKTSTGYGFVKLPDDKYTYHGATEHDVALMRKHSAPEVQIKAAGGIRNIGEVLKFRELGATRIGTTSTATILEQAKDIFRK